MEEESGLWSLVIFRDLWCLSASFSFSLSFSLSVFLSPSVNLLAGRAQGEGEGEGEMGGEKRCRGKDGVHDYDSDQ